MLDVLVILDRSGSMQDAKSDHEGGLRAFVKDQAALPGEVRLTVVKFDGEDPCEIACDRVPIGQAPEVRLDPRGSTPLFDAIGMAVSHLSARQATEPSDATVCMVVTDGANNASREWTRARVKALVAEKEAAGWAFLYLGANVDAFAEGDGLGVVRTRSVGYDNSRGQTVSAAYRSLSANTLKYRAHAYAAGGTFTGFVKTLDFTDEQRVAAGGGAGAFSPDAVPLTTTVPIVGSMGTCGSCGATWAISAGPPVDCAMGSCASPRRRRYNSKLS